MHWGLSYEKKKEKRGDEEGNVLLDVRRLPCLSQNSKMQQTPACQKIGTRATEQK